MTVVPWLLTSVSLLLAPRLISLTGRRRCCGFRLMSMSAMRVKWAYRVKWALLGEQAIIR